MPSSPQSRWPVGALGMLALVALVEWYVSHRGMSFLDVDDWAFLRSERVAQHEARRYEILCFGDSRVKLGVVPQALRDRTGRPAYNLAVSGSQPAAAYFLLKRVLASGARPAAIIVDFQPTLLSLGPRHLLMRWPALTTLPEAAQLAWWARDPELFGQLAVGRLLPSFHARQGIDTNLVAALGGRLEDGVWRNAVTRRHWRLNQGAQLHPADPGLANRGADFFESIRRDYYPRWSCHPASSEGIAHFLALASEYRVPVYWVLTPLLPGVRRALADSGFEAEQDAFVRSWQARFPGLVVIDGRRTLTDPTAFFDHNHLSARGAYGFSLALGEVLRNTIPNRGRSSNPRSSRWLQLPDWQPARLPHGVEDLDQSRLALQGDRPARR